MSIENSILCVYDIPDALSIKNPSRKFRRFGFRVNLSCWVFPANHVPSDDIDELRVAGATVHMVRFAAEDQGKILDLCRAELQKSARKMLAFYASKTDPLKKTMEAWANIPRHKWLELDVHGNKVRYKKWRTLINKVRRELEAAEQCAFAFEIGRDCADAFSAVKKVLAVELEAALLWKDRLQQKPFQAMELPMVEAPADECPLCGKPLCGETGVHSACHAYEEWIADMQAAGSKGGAA